jgi:hypothetical protein
MLNQILIGSFIICTTIVSTVAIFAIASLLLTKWGSWLEKGKKPVKLVIALSAVVMWLLAALSLAIWIWALAFLWVGEFEILEESVYFSIVSFTTLGFGDVIVSNEWRLLSGMVAANGFLLFSLATAFLIEFLTRIRNAQHSEEK